MRHEARRAAQVHVLGGADGRLGGLPAVLRSLACQFNVVPTSKNQSDPRVFFFFFSTRPLSLCSQEVFDKSDNFWMCIFWDVVFHLPLGASPPMYISAIGRMGSPDLLGRSGKARFDSSQECGHE